MINSVLFLCLFLVFRKKMCIVGEPFLVKVLFGCIKNSFI